MAELCDAYYSGEVDEYAQATEDSRRSKLPKVQEKGGGNMRFKAIRTKDMKTYVKSGNCPALFKEDYDFEFMFSFGMARPRDAYEIVTVELTVIDDGEEKCV